MKKYCVLNYKDLRENIKYLVDYMWGVRKVEES